jgi:hypothetical protein
MRLGIADIPRPAGPLPHYGRANFYNYRDHCNGAATPPRSLGIASRLMVAFAIGTGRFGVSILGAIADHFSAENALNSTRILLLAGLLLSLPIKYPTVVQAYRSASHSSSRVGQSIQHSSQLFWSQRATVFLSPMKLLGLPSLQISHSASCRQ